MLTIETLFSAFQVKAIVGLEPGKQLAELSHHGFERKRPTCATGTKLASRPFTRHEGTSLGAE
jgi:hypothetical protein